MPETLIPAGSTVGALQIRPLLDPLDNRILLGHALGLSRVSLITQSERVLTSNETERLSSLLARACRASRSPTSSASANFSACRSK